MLRVFNEYIKEFSSYNPMNYTSISFDLCYTMKNGMSLIRSDVSQVFIVSNYFKQKKAFLKFHLLIGTKYLCSFVLWVIF